MARQLDVFLGSDKIGVLEQDNHGSLWFGYDPKSATTTHMERTSPSSTTEARPAWPRFTIW